MTSTTNAPQGANQVVSANDQVPNPSQADLRQNAVAAIEAMIAPATVVVCDQQTAPKELQRAAAEWGINSTTVGVATYRAIEEINGHMSNISMATAVSAVANTATARAVQKNQGPTCWWQWLIAVVVGIITFAVAWNVLMGFQGDWLIALFLGVIALALTAYVPHWPVMREQPTEVEAEAVQAQNVQVTDAPPVQEAPTAATTQTGAPSGNGA